MSSGLNSGDRYLTNHLHMTIRYLERYDWPFSLLDSCFSSLLGRPSHATIKKSDDKSYVVYFEIPGFKQDEVKLEIDGPLLTVRAENTQRSYTETLSLLSLGRDFDTDTVSAELRDGILKVTLARKALPEPRKVPIKSSVS